MHSILITLYNAVKSSISVVRTSTAECYSLVGLVAVYDQPWMLKAFPNWIRENVATSTFTWEWGISS